MKRNLTLFALLAALFLILLVLVLCADVAAIGPAGTRIGLSRLNQAVHSGVGVHPALYEATELLGYLAILAVVCFACCGLVQMIRRRRILAVDREILALGGLYIAVGALYVFFEKVIVNYRPILMPGETAPKASFPSSHTLLAVAVFGSTAILVPRYVKGRAARRALQALCVALIVVMELLRLLSGVHWLTDIVAGALLGGALLALYAAVIGPRKTA